MDEGDRIHFTKEAKSAKDRAEEAAIALGKPTTTGIAAGAGVGTLLATLGAISRGKDEKNHSLITNPLLLGALGTAGGYLAGNAFEHMPSDHQIVPAPVKTLAPWLMAGAGLASLTSAITKKDRRHAVAATQADMLNTFRNLRTRDLGDGIMPMVDREVTLAATRRGERDLQRLLELTRDDRRGVDMTRSRLPGAVKERMAMPLRKHIEALRNNGMEERASQLESDFRSILPAVHREGQRQTQNMAERGASRIKNWLVNGRFSPVSTIKAFNPFKKVPGGLAGQLNRLLIKPSLTSRSAMIPRLAALAALGGTGKIVYDKITD